MSKCHTKLVQCRTLDLQSSYPVSWVDMRAFPSQGRHIPEMQARLWDDNYSGEVRVTPNKSYQCKRPVDIQWRFFLQRLSPFPPTSDRIELTYFPPYRWTLRHRAATCAFKEILHVSVQKTQHGG